MLKRIALFSIALLGFSGLGFSVAAHARTPMSPRVPLTFKVDGTRAEFLFNAMSKFESIAGLEGTADCAMGTCSTAMKNTSCTKSMVEGPSDIFPGEMNQPFMTCSILKTDGKGAFRNVSYRDTDGVRELRHALVEITGKESKIDQTKSVTVKSIDCTAHAINRDMDSIDTESTYECTVVY